MNTTLINTIAEGIAFLETLDLRVTGVWQGWSVSGAVASNRDFNLFFEHNSELIEYARYERDVAAKLCRGSDDRGLHQLLNKTSNFRATKNETTAEQPHDGPLGSDEEASEEVKR